jgi:hypothetical protein
MIVMTLSLFTYRIVSFTYRIVSTSRPNKGDRPLTVPDIFIADSTNTNQPAARLRIAKHGRLVSIQREGIVDKFHEGRVKDLIALNYLDNYPVVYSGDTGSEYLGCDVEDYKNGTARVYGLSKASRRRLLRLAMSLDLRQSAIALGLTYPDDFPEDQEEWHRHLLALKRCLLRRFSQMSRNARGKRQYKLEFAAIWRIEFDIRESGELSRGRVAPHMHIVLFLTNGVPTETWRHWLKELWQWLSNTWNRIINSHNRGYQKARIHVKTLKQERKRNNLEYFLRYIAKPDAKRKPDDFNIADHYPMGTGRVWGVWYKEHLPLSETMEILITLEQFDVLQRYFKSKIWKEVREDIQFNTLQCLLNEDFKELILLLEQHPGPDPDQIKALLAQLYT